MTIMISMKQLKHCLIFVIPGFVSLLAGLLIYLFYRPNSYISILLQRYVSFDLNLGLFDVFNNKFIKFYFVDYLWAFSLSCGLHLIFMPRRIGTYAITAVVFLYGMIYEVLQLCSIIDGTGDILDVLLYALAGITVNIINLQRRNLK